MKQQINVSITSFSYLTEDELWLVYVVNIMVIKGLFRHDNIAGPCRGKCLQLLEKQKLIYVGQFLTEQGSFGPEPLVFGSQAVTVVKEKLQPIVQFPVFNPK